MSEVQADNVSNIEKAARVLCEWHEEDSFDGDVCSACMSMAQALADAGLLAPEAAETKTQQPKD